MLIKIDAREALSTLGISELQELKTCIDERLDLLRGTGLLTETEVALCKAELWIDAIKAVWKRRGEGLKEAKVIVDQWREANGMMPPPIK